MYKRQTGPSAARALGERIADAVRAAAVHRGTPLSVSIGLAICPEDGTAALGLAEHADEGLFAARAAGTGLA